MTSEPQTDGRGTPERVAFDLLRVIANVEDMRLPGLTAGATVTDREWVLNTYRECLRATKLLPPKA